MLRSLSSAGLLALFVVSEAACAAELVVTLASQVEVAGRNFSLGEVAQIQGEDAPAMQALRDLRVGQLGLAGRELLLTRLESSNTPSTDELQTVEVAEMVRSMVAELRPVDRDEHLIEMDLDSMIAARGIEQELYSAISNLLVNALRYSPKGSEVKVSWQRVGDRGRCSVKDNGVGIATEHLARITERFYRVDLGRSRSLGGTGLGLAIVKHVLRRHGCELQIESTPGSGSTFWFELDAAHVRVRDNTSGVTHGGV